jgi:hypothetical protein
MDMGNLADFATRVVLPLATLIGSAIGWWVGRRSRQIQGSKDRSQLINDFQASNDELFTRLHEMQILDLEAASKNNTLIKQNTALKLENEDCRKEVSTLKQKITDLKIQLKRKP